MYLLDMFSPFVGTYHNLTELLKYLIKLIFNCVIRNRNIMSSNPEK